MENYCTTEHETIAMGSKRLKDEKIDRLEDRIYIWIDGQLK